MILRAALLAALVACASCPRPPDDSAHTLRVAVEQMPGTLDPRWATDAQAVRILDAVLRGLVHTEYDGRPRLDLAERIDPISETTLRVTLRAGQRFHDGVTIDAQVVAATLRTLADPKTGSPHAAALAGLREVRIDGSLVLELNLSRPASALAAALELPIIHPLDLTAPVVDAPRGSGPFRLAGRLRGAEGWRLERVGEAPPDGIRAIEVRVVADPSALAFALESGDVDLALNAVAVDDLARLRANPDFVVEQFPGWNVSYLGLRWGHAALSDGRVRRALLLAIDRPALVATLLRHTARVHDSLLPPAHPLVQAMIPEAPQPARAAQLLDEAGWPDPDGSGPAMRFRLVYKTSTHPERVRIAQAIADCWRRLGIDVDLQTMEFTAFFADVRAANFDVYGLTWVGVADPSLYEVSLHSRSTPPTGLNRGRVVDPELDRLIDLAMVAKDAPEQRAAWAAVQLRAAADLPVIPLWAHDTVVVRRARLASWRPNPGGGLRSLADIALQDVH